MTVNEQPSGISLLNDLIAQKVGDKSQVLFYGETGSTMWSMGTPDSDHDVVVVYANNIFDMLAGRISGQLPVPNFKGKVGNAECDISFMEVTHFCNLLKKGNVNAIWTATTTVVINNTDIFKQLQSIIYRHPSKAMWPSIKGIALSNVFDIERRKDVRSPRKSFTSAIRILAFYSELLTTCNFTYDSKKLPFISKSAAIAPEGFMDYYNEVYEYVEYAHNNVYKSGISEAMPIRLIEEWLLYVRMEQLAASVSP